MRLSEAGHEFCQPSFIRINFSTEVNAVISYNCRIQNIMINYCLSYARVSLRLTRTYVNKHCEKFLDFSTGPNILLYIL